MASNSDFFGQRNPQAVLKHGVLTRYAHYFAGRAGKASRGKVAFIDGYAGAGRYEDGNPGSPLLLASQASRAGLFGRNVKLAFVEPDKAMRGRLITSLADEGIEPDAVLDEPFEQAADALLDKYAGHAVLLFVDPFGLGMDRSTLVRIAKLSTARRPVDIVYHFSLLTVARMGRAGLGDSPTERANAVQLDEALGTVGWREDFKTADEEGSATRAAIEVARRFASGISTEANVKNTAIPVRQRPTHLPKYLLILFSRDQKAHWDFADVAAKAHVDWLHHCDTADYKANLQLQQSSGIQTLWEDPAPEAEDIEKLLSEETFTYLTTHLTDLLRAREELRPIDAIEDSYGEMFGRARVMHLRKAIKSLYAKGLINDTGVGDFWDRTIQWNG